jgi:hypothetical protein
MRHYSYHLPLLICFIFVSATIASANCLMFPQNERLTNYCIMSKVDGKRVDAQTANFVIQRLQREGYFGGLSSPQFLTQVYPTFTYSDNINGGNPDKKLKLGNLEFNGEPALVAKEGVVGSLNFAASNRTTIDEGRYIDASAVLSSSYSPEHALSYTTTNIRLCSKNKINKDTHIDICASTSSQNKDITRDQTDSLSASWGKMFYAENFGFNEAKLGLTRVSTGDLEQGQLQLSLDTIHDRNLFTSVSLKYGEPVEGSLALNYGIGLGVSGMIRSRKVTLNINHEYRDGGQLLGVEQIDKVTSVSLSTQLRRDTNITLGYKSSNSSIDYFDQHYPIVTLTQEW